MPAFGTANVGWLDSFRLEVGGELTSQPFNVPGGFTGHLYVHGIGGNEQAIFAVGSDGNANFSGGGFVAKLQHNLMPDVQLEQVAPFIWRFVKLPQFGAP